MLPRFTYRPIRALAESLFDSGAGIPPARLDWLLKDLADFVGRAGPKTKTFFIVTLTALEFLPLFFGFFGRMSRLPLEKRLAYLERVDHSALAPVIALPKALLGLIYYEHPEALLETGYDHLPLIVAGTSEDA